MRKIATATDLGTVNPADSDYSEGSFKNETSDGAGDGSLMKDVQFNDLYYAMYNVILAYVGTISDVGENTSGDAGTDDFLAALVAAFDAEADTEFITPTAGTEALTQTANGSYTYDIADFTGTGLDTDQIRGLYVECVCAASSSTTCDILATFPGSSTGVSICHGYSNIVAKCVAFVPINKGQTSLDIEIDLTGGGASFEIIGLKQRTFSG